MNVEAGNELVSVTLGASGGQAKTVAVNGVVLVNVTSATTVAQVARGATVAATGTASIQARDATWVGTVAGAAAGSQTVGVGMSVAINDVNRDTQALIGQWRDDATPVTGAAGSFSAGKLLIGSENKGFVGNLAVSGSRVSSPVAGAGDGTGAGGAGGTAGGGTDVLGTKAPASQGGATPGKDSAAPDPDELLSLSDILKELSNSTSTLTQDSGSGSGSGGGGSQQQSKAGVAISGAVAVNMVNDFAQAYINAAGLTITIGGDATISATNGTHALALSGAVALAQPDNAKTNVGIAGAYSMNGLGGEARAEVALVGSLLVAGDLALSARRTGVAVTLAAGMAGAKGQKGVALAGSAAVTTANYGNIAPAGQRHQDQRARREGRGARQQRAGHRGRVRRGDGRQGRRGRGGGGEHQQHRVEAGIRQAIELLYTGKLDVSAESSQVAVGFAGALGVARDGAGVGGSVTVNVIANRIESYILNSQVRYDGTDSSGHDINVSALDKTTLIAITGAAGVGKKAGVGIAISYNDIGNAVLAGIQGSVVNNKGGSVSVTAEDNSALGGGAVGVGVGMGEAMFAGAGSIQVNRVHSAVAAYVLPRAMSTTRPWPAAAPSRPTR